MNSLAKGMSDMEMIEKVARAISIPQHHTTWDVLSDAEKDLFYMQAEYAIAAYNPDERLREALEAIRDWREGSPQPASLNWQRIAKAFQETARSALSPLPQGDDT